MENLFVPGRLVFQSRPEARTEHLRKSAEKCPVGPRRSPEDCRKVNDEYFKSVEESKGINVVIERVDEYKKRYKFFEVNPGVNDKAPLMVEDMNGILTVHKLDGAGNYVPVSGSPHTIAQIDQFLEGFAAAEYRRVSNLSQKLGMSSFLGRGGKVLRTNSGIEVFEIKHNPSATPANKRWEIVNLITGKKVGVTHASLKELTKDAGNIKEMAAYLKEIQPHSDLQGLVKNVFEKQYGLTVSAIDAMKRTGRVTVDATFARAAGEVLNFDINWDLIPGRKPRFTVVKTTGSTGGILEQDELGTVDSLDQLHKLVHTAMLGYEAPKESLLAPTDLTYLEALKSPAGLNYTVKRVGNPGKGEAIEISYTDSRGLKVFKIVRKAQNGALFYDVVDTSGRSEKAVGIKDVSLMYVLMTNSVAIAKIIGPRGRDTMRTAGF